MLEFVDLYCGAGGLSLGLSNAGLIPRIGVDSNAACELTYSENIPDGTFLRANVKDITAEQILSFFSNRKRVVLVGGPPCQLFSRLNRQPKKISSEVRHYVKLVQDISPLYAVFENVPAILRRSVAWNLVINNFKNCGYHVVSGILKATDFGVPQNRERLIVIAGKNEVFLPSPTSSPEAISVRSAIGHFPAAPAGIPNHHSMALSDENLKRIKQLKAGQNFRKQGESFSDSYSRMSWNKPAPTITTKCISFSNGRFGHPKFNRAITVREAATLQGFPENFHFHGNLIECAKQVGNAVPPPIAEAIGKELLHSYQKLLGTRTKRKAA